MSLLSWTANKSAFCPTGNIFSIFQSCACIYLKSYSKKKSFHKKCRNTHNPWSMVSQFLDIFHYSLYTFMRHWEATVLYLESSLFSFLKIFSMLFKKVLLFEPHCEFQFDLLHLMIHSTNIYWALSMCQTLYQQLDMKHWTRQTKPLLSWKVKKLNNLRDC